MHRLLTTIAITLCINGFAQTIRQNNLDSLVGLARIMSSENPQEARRIVLEIERKAKQTNTPSNQIVTHSAYAEFYIANKLWPQANAHIDSATSIAVKQKDIASQFDLLILQSKSQFKAGEYDQYQKTLNAASRLVSKNKQPGLLIESKLANAEFSKERNNHIEAIKILNQALASANKIASKEYQSECYLNLGSTYWQTGHYSESLEYYYKSLIIKESTNDSIGVIHLLKNIGLTYRELGQYEKGISNLERGLGIARNLNNQIEIADLMNIIGSLHFRFNRFEESIKHYQNSLSIRKELGLIRSQITSHENIARAQSRLMLYKEAIDNLSTALILQEQLVDPLAEASTLTEMGNLNLLKGNVAESLRRYLMALKIRQEFGTDEDIAKSLTNIGLAYRRLGMFKSALKYLEQAHEIIDQNKLNINDASYILQNLGHIYLDQKEFKKALTVYKEALALKERGGDVTGTARLLKNIAQAQIQIGNPSGARAALVQALKISNRIKDSREIADIYNEMGNVERLAKNYDTALKHFKKAADLYHSSSV